MVRMALALLAGLLTTVAYADDSKLKVKEGDKFPDVKLAAAQIEKAKPDAKTISIADFKGKTVVIFFYPKASTKGCTVESCGFRDIAEKFPKGTVVRPSLRVTPQPSWLGRRGPCLLHVWIRLGPKSNPGAQTRITC